MTPGATGTPSSPTIRTAPSTGRPRAAGRAGSTTIEVKAGAASVDVYVLMTTAEGKIRARPAASAGGSGAAVEPTSRTPVRSARVAASELTSSAAIAGTRKTEPMP